MDATVGEGGHAVMIASRLSASGTLVCLDRDAEVLAIARERLSPYACRQVFIHDDFRRLPRRLSDEGVAVVDGVLMDLGISSYHLSCPERGFSFRHEGPLDMRLDRRGETAARLIARCSEQALAELFRRYGEEPRARAIARAIVAQRKRAPIRTTTELASIVARSVGSRRRHPATRIFQALRIAVNRELDDLDKAVQAAARLLKEAGRLVVITFHSLEDRIVKQALASLQGEGEVAVLTRKPLTPDREEVARNPRARSAKLRAAERTAPGRGMPRRGGCAGMKSWQNFVVKEVP